MPAAAGLLVAASAPPKRAVRRHGRREAQGRRLVAVPRWARVCGLPHANAGKAALAAATGSELRAAGGHGSGEAGPPGRNDCGNQRPTAAASRGGALQGRRGQADSRTQERSRREHGGQHGHRTGAWPRRRRVALRRGMFPTLEGQSSRGSSVQQRVPQASLEGGSPSRLDAPRQGDPPQPDVPGIGSVTDGRGGVLRTPPVAPPPRRPHRDRWQSKPPRSAGAPEAAAITAARSTQACHGHRLAKNPNITDAPPRADSCPAAGTRAKTP